MAEFKGTKGIWEINSRASRNVRCNGITIANCSSGQNGDDQEEEEANAKLIASAPEMFEALKLCREYFLLKTDSKSEERADYIGEILKKATK